MSDQTSEAKNSSANTLTLTGPEQDLLIRLAGGHLADAIRNPALLERGDRETLADLVVEHIMFNDPPAGVDADLLEQRLRGTGPRLGTTDEAPGDAFFGDGVF